jgi:hypothetical protein
MGEVLSAADRGYFHGSYKRVIGSRVNMHHAGLQEELSQVNAKEQQGGPEAANITEPS